MTKYLVYLICSITLIGGEMNLGNENTIPSFKSSISTESSVNVAPILKEISSLDKCRLRNLMRQVRLYSKGRK